jgi:tRNA 2-thiouridine synthesizing protein A
VINSKIRVKYCLKRRLEEDCRKMPAKVSYLGERMKDNIEDVTANAELDCVGLFCPLPIARTKEEIENIEVGQVLRVEADDPAAEEDISRWAKRVGHEVVKLEKSGNIITFWIRRKK